MLTRRMDDGPGLYAIAIVLTGEAVRAIGRHKLRSALTTIGITIGIAAVVLVVAVGRAGALKAEEQLRNLGDNVVWVEAGARTVTGIWTGSRGTNTLTLEDTEAIGREVRLIKRVSPNVDGKVLAAYERQNWTTGYRGVWASYLDIKGWRIAEGAPFTTDQDARVANVVLLGKTVRERLFGAEPAVGKLIRLAGQPFTVVGVLAPKGQNANGYDQDDTVMMPFLTAQKRIQGKNITWLDDILCSAVSPEAVDAAIVEIQKLLRQRHHIVGEDDDFNIRRPEEVIKAQLKTNRTFSLLLLTIASVSMLVGGIGIMNVMLASVAERTKEIGVRLAVGASEGAVQLQFLAEAVALSVLGGTLGVGASLLGAYGFERFLGWLMPIPPNALMLALGVSVAIGVFFGFYPAWRASRLDPIQALHRE
jgi:putative ABC transport system permease protein